ncbi:exosortase Y-associated Wzy-like protein [Mucilaginibacter dorajii]|uniref:Transmembrane protein n=1 Tax=Mucilaginibacter dorajii TaxID=692994 RepID=A0ABP7Q2K0_9SPHI|nr:hypothetical protein [Mucilaginibacter dorajii]MCS3732781.1 hypothetical protein [Mucilaginibacter dorajii]
MDKNISYERLIVLYLPWALSLLIKKDGELSYMIAWLGSFMIFFLTLTGWVKPIPNDRSIAEQLMRPIFLVQIIFAGYMACTSIFYYMDALGYENFVKSSTILVDENKLQLIVQCQQYYCLAHASVATGMLVFMDYSVKSKYYIEKQKLANLLMMFSVVSFPVSIIFLRLPGLSQFYYQLNSLSFIAGTLALAFAIPLKKVANTILCLCFYFFNFYQALISGFKEPIIISVLVLGIFLYPNYKKLVAAIFIPLMLLLFMFLPTYNHIFRENAWKGDTNAEDASQLALSAALNGDSDDIDDSNWGFLVYRLSEIDMFIKFTQSTPKNIDYYNFKLIKQSAMAIIPRIFWPTKPSTEDMIMERVYDAGVINRNSVVSAKPAFVVDAYLSGGSLAIFILLFIYGAVAQFISMKAERLFGGYILGTALVFSGLFQIMWRGLSFEFIINTVFWSYVTMIVIHKVLLSRNILKKV